MKDKVQKIREKVVWLMSNHDSALDYEAALEDVLNIIDSMQEEPVSEDLVKYTSKIILEGANFNKSWYAHPELAFKAGAKWQKEQMMVKAIDATARPDDNEIWCNLASSNLKDGDKVKIIVIKKD